jgi:hypothetical protein
MILARGISMRTLAAHRLHLHTTLLAVLAGAAPAWAQSVFTGPIASSEIARGVYLLSAGSNAVLVLGRDSAVLVDGLVSAQSAALVKRASSAPRSSPPRMLRAPWPERPRTRAAA